MPRNRTRRELPRIRRRRRQAETLAKLVDLALADPGCDEARSALLTYAMRMVSNSADDAIEITTVSEAVLDNLATVTNAQLGDAVRRLTLEARRRARADEALAGQLAQLAALPPITPNPEGTE